MKKQNRTTKSIDGRYTNSNEKYNERHTQHLAVHH